MVPGARVRPRPRSARRFYRAAVWIWPGFELAGGLGNCGQPRWNVTAQSRVVNALIGTCVN
ncbi:hypothetical protein [Lysobacter gummosus]|uniref:hypothetical protein n=1 Tax=Lysobacter gummosus TaxID=262324 RepID=UPI00362CE616